MAINKNFRADADSEAWWSDGTLYGALVDQYGNQVSGYKSLGVLQSVEVTFDIARADLYSRLRGPRSKIASKITTKDGAISITFNNFSASNLSWFLYGDLTEVEEQTAGVETIKAWLSSTQPLNGIVEGNVVVKLDTVTYEEGKNYEVNEGSIYFYSTAEQTALGAVANITEGALVTVTYDSKTVKNIEAYVNDSLRLALYFEGRNTADEETVEKIFLHLVEFDPTGFPIYSPDEDFGELTVEGQLLASRAIQGAGKSQFMRKVSIR